MSPPAPAAVAARAGCRVDLAGGTLDIWPIGLLHADACTVNVGLDLVVAVELRPRAAGYRVVQDGAAAEAPTLAELARAQGAALAATVLTAFAAPPLEVRLHSDSPPGGGLGGSSALTVALIAALEAHAGRPASPPRRGWRWPAISRRA